METVVIGIIVALIVLLVFTIIYIQPKTLKEGFISMDDIMQNMKTSPDFLSSLYKSDVEIRNQSTLNCYDYMKNTDATKDWIEEGMTNRAKNRMKVLSTLRTNINHFDDTNSTSAVTMGGCFIPDDVGRTLYNIDGANNRCTIEDTRNNKIVNLIPTKDGCMMDFTDPNFNTAEKFNNVLDTAYAVYDKENIDIIEDLKTQIKKLEDEIKQLNDAISSNNTQRDNYKIEKEKLEEYNSDCQTKKRDIAKMYSYIQQLQNNFNDAMKLLNYYRNLKGEVDSASQGLDEEYQLFSQFK